MLWMWSLRLGNRVERYSAAMLDILTVEARRTTNGRESTVHARRTVVATVIAVPLP